MTKKLRLILCVVLIGIIARVVLIHLCNDRGLPTAEGILNFGRIDDHLYRGAQPDAGGIEHLQQLGVALIINLCKTNEVWSLEPAEAHNHSMLYTNIPLGGLGRPDQQEMVRILALIEDATGPVFVHCEHGCDRTGTVIACYRIKHDRWDAHAALKEADRYGMSPFERGMRAYVADFASQLTSSSAAKH